MQVQDKEDSVNGSAGLSVFPKPVFHTAGLTHSPAVHTDKIHRVRETALSACGSNSLYKYHIEESQSSISLLGVQINLQLCSALQCK